MRWILAVVAIMVVALGAGAFISNQGTGAQGTTSGTPCPSPMAGTPTVMASPTAMASPAASPEACPSRSSGLTVEMVDIAFNPNEFSIPANTDITVYLPNTGAALHNFSVTELGIDVDVNPGDTGSVTINAPAGTYEFICDIPGHAAAGMVGTMTVQ